MGEMLSQAEIDALLNGTPGIGNESSVSNNDDSLTLQEIDALGEIGNISMGTSATTLFTLLAQKVLITTPKVVITSWEDMSKQYQIPYVAVKVEYVNGLIGSNLLILKEKDVKVITDLMMGGDGTNIEGELTELHLSAISEAMNQMIGSSATSMSSMFNKRIEISPPKAFVIHFDKSTPESELDNSQRIVKISFNMTIGDLLDSEIMQLIPISFAKSLVENILNTDVQAQGQSAAQAKKGPDVQQVPVQTEKEVPGQPARSREQQYAHPPQTSSYAAERTDTGHIAGDAIPRGKGPVNVQPALFQSFDDGKISLDKKNIGMIMDVPLQVTVELGRTNKLIKDILEFGPGSIIELDKLAGEPVDILVNGKAIAKGEVVVIDESFAVRITDILHPSKRL